MECKRNVLTCEIEDRGSAARVLGMYRIQVIWSAAGVPGLYRIQVTWSAAGVLGMCEMEVTRDKRWCNVRAL
ncbi:hypothetical protein FGB62_10g30 [Gracilaria domingensis]|nr:hypothetical protein FGB62_10g30 [Gracilaria domingensis]